MKYFFWGVFASVLISCGSDEGSDQQLNSDKRITGFSIPDITSTIDESTRTITLMVSNRRNLSSLTPTIAISSGASVSPASNTAQDFSNGINYTVTAEDGTTSQYSIQIERFYSFSFDNHFYEVVLDNKSWAEAASFSANLGGYLVEINNEAEQNKVFGELSFNSGIIFEDTQNEFGNSAVWLGGNDIATEGAWIWDGNNSGEGSQFWSGGLDGTPVDNLYNNWGNEPDNSSNQDALSISMETTQRNMAGEWNDLDGGNRLYYLIEYDQ
ncbi:MAG: DUF5018 domain-containing protein [Bacteroidota bacterium]